MEPKQNNSVLPTPPAPGPVTPAPTPPPVSSDPLPKRFNLNLPVILAAIMLVVAIALGILAIIYIQKFNSAQVNVNQNRTEAAAIAREEQKQVDEKAFAEREKEPYRSYQAPGVLGAIKAEFPKTWNVYAEEDEASTSQLNVFMAPDVVKPPKSTSEPYSFRIRLERKLYADVLLTYQRDIDQGKLTAKNVTVSGITGTRMEGQIDAQRTGVLTLLPIRDKTLYLWTESNNFVEDYNRIIERMSVSP